MKKCPFCGANIEDSARFCLYCMHSLTEKEQIFPQPKKKLQRWLTVAAIVAILLVLVMMWFLIQSGSENGISSDDSHLNSTPSASQTTPSDTPPVTTPPHTHNFSVSNTSVEYQKEAATCTNPAIFYYSCTCGEMGSNTFSHGEPNAHMVVTDPGYPANCTTPGLTDGAHCSACKAVLLAQTPVPITRHTFDNDQDETCNVCNYVRVINCRHPETVKLSAVPSTCIASGLTEGEKCAFCEEILTAQTMLVPLGHTEVIDPAIEPTCTAEGASEGKHCATCNAILVAQSSVSAKGHTKVIDQAVAATCTAEGKTEGAHCSVCQVVFLYPQTTPALGHSLDPGDIAAPCSRCGIVLHIHSFTEKNTDAKYLKSAASCEQAAQYYYSCICGKKGEPYFRYGSETGHTFVTEPGYPPTCTTTGLTDRVYCSVCGDTFSDAYELAPTGHTFALSDSLPACLVCGEMGTVIVRFTQNPYCQSDVYRIDSCTYTVSTTVYEDLVFNLSITYTNISDTRSPAVYFSLYSYGLGYAMSGGRLMPLDPNESGSCTYSCIVTDLGDTYELRFR